MGLTFIEKIIADHCDRVPCPGDVVDMKVDVRAARDFGGANVVKNLQRAGLDVADPQKTLFTFDCNPGGSDQGYAANQQFCRGYARETGVGLRDITQGIGTHIALEEGLVGPGTTFVSTDSHANIMGAVGAFGQGMGDQDIAYAWATGKVWFKTPPTIKVVLEGRPSAAATPKDIALAMLRDLGANGLLGCAAEITGPAADALDLPGRITVASMATEMGGIIALFIPDEKILAHCAKVAGHEFPAMAPDPDAEYRSEIVIDVDGIGPMTARPGHPEDVVTVAEVAGAKIDSVFIGSCTNGRIEDLRAATAVLEGRKVAPGVVLKIVPSTRTVWEQALAEGLVDKMMKAGALIGNAGCAGCAAGQIGQNGPGEVTVSTGNRNYAGKQGKGEVYLASPATAAASAVSGVLASADAIPDRPAIFVAPEAAAATTGAAPTTVKTAAKPNVLEGQVWIVDVDNIDTDMIFHNRYLAITDIAEMGQYAFDNLEGWRDFAAKAAPGDIVITSRNFGCGSSRQQAVDCFTSLGVQALVARSYGAIYERNAINAGMPVVVADLVAAGLENGDTVKIDLKSGRIEWDGGAVDGQPFSDVQMEIYQRGGLLVKSE